MLNSILFFIISSIYGLFKILSRLFGVDYIFAVIDAALEPIHELKQKKIVIVAPSHIAVAILEKKLLSWKHLYDFVQHAGNSGVKRITFYDPFNFLKQNQDKFISRLKIHLKTRNSNVFPILNFENPSISNLEGYCFINLTILGSKDGRGSLTRVCKKLCHKKTEILISDIDNKLEDENIFEPDLLVKFGSTSSLGGYSPWSLRITEIVSLSRFQNDSYFSMTEFERILIDFSSRDRRLGK